MDSSSILFSRGSFQKPIAISPVFGEFLERFGSLKRMGKLPLDFFSRIFHVPLLGRVGKDQYQSASCKRSVRQPRNKVTELVSPLIPQFGMSAERKIS